MRTRFALPWVFLALAGCSAGPSSSGPASVDAPRSPAETDKASRDAPVRINRTLIYPVRYGLAEDLATTLEPILVSRYGSGVRIVPQVSTNKLLIYLPPREEQEASLRQQSGPTGSPRRRSARTPGGRRSVR
jgi:hypothetical protein